MSRVLPIIAAVIAAFIGAGSSWSQSAKPDLSGLSRDERRMVESACSYHQTMSGPAAYYQCLRRQVKSLAGSSGPPDLSGLSRDERRMVESACSYHQTMSGPAAYYQCLRRQVKSLAGSSGPPDLSGLSRDERRMAESACSYHQTMSGPAAYYQCLRRQVKSLGSTVARTAPPGQADPLPEEPPTQSKGARTKSPRTSREPARTSIQTVRLIQERLTELGYNPGPVDGVAGPKTRTAIGHFQADYELPVTRTASDELAWVLQVAIVARARGGSSPEQQPSVRPGADTTAMNRKAVPELYATGTGFAVTADGWVITNHHIVKDCAELRSPPHGTLRVLAADTQNDLALLELPTSDTTTASFRQGRGIRPGDDVVVAGFPLHGLLAPDLNITTGNVSALAGPGSDRRYIQITAPVQPGNSGGPLLDLSGNVVGVVVGKLNAMLIADLTGDIPQNVNFAISEGTLRAFLDAHNVAYELAPSRTQLTARDVADRAREYTVLIECWK